MPELSEVVTDGEGITPAEKLRMNARAKLKGAADLAFTYIESLENAVGTQRAQGAVYESYRTVVYTYGYTLAVSSNQKLMKALGPEKGYIYPTTLKYTRFAMWVDTLWEMKEIKDEWKKDRVSTALFDTQRWAILNSANKCAERLRKMYSGNRPLWLIDELYDELVDMLYNEDSEIEDDPKTLLMVFNLSKRVLDLMEPELMEEITNFKSVIQQEPGFASEGMDKYRKWQKDFTRASQIPKAIEEEE